LIVGGGSIGERHLRCFQHVGAEVALCETHPPRQTEIAERYQVAQTFATVAAAAAHDWDAVAICTPAHLHVEHAVQLAPRTPALLIEKPLATQLANARQLVPALRGKFVQIAYVLRCHPAVEAVRGLLAAGKLGRLSQATVVAGQHFPTFRPAYREIYYANRATGGGAIQDAATHLFDVVQHLAGRFRWVFCDAGHQALAGVDVEDTVHLQARAGGSGGDVLVSIALNQFMAPNETVLQLNGSDGSAQIRFHEHRYGFFPHGAQGWQWSEPLVHERDDLFRLQARQFLEAAAGRGSATCSLHDALHTLQINLAALESNGERRVAIGED
jgi:predicted dehydrogenase